MTDDTPDPAPDAELTTVSLAKHLARHGGACRSHRMTINRWCSKGILVAGRRVKLRAVRRGGRWVIRWCDYQEFLRVCTVRAGGEADQIRTPAEIRRASRKASDEMDRLFEAATKAAKAGLR